MSSKSVPRLAASKAEEKKTEEKTEEVSDTRPSCTRVVSSKRATLNAKLRTSPYLHVTPKESADKSESFYDLQPSASNVPCGRNLSCNNKWLGFNWKSGGGSNFYTRLINAPERAGGNPLCVKGQLQLLTSHDFSMLNEDQLAVGSQNGKVMVFKLPASGKFDKNLTEPEVDLLPDNEDKVTCVKFSPVIDNLLAVSTSGDRHKLLLFNASTGRNPYCLGNEHEDQIMDIAFDPYGHLLCTTCKDGFARVINPRGEECVKLQVKGMVRDCRAFWVDREHIVFAGTGKGSRRSVSIWNWRTGTELCCHMLDTNSTALITHFDFASRILYCASMGDRQCFVFEIEPLVFPFVSPLDTYKMPAGQFGGMAWLHNDTADVKKVEVGRCLKLTKNSIVAQTWSVPRKRLEFFQDDIIHPIVSNKAVMSADDWFGGKSPEGAEPVLVDRCPAGMELLSDAPEEELTVRQQRYQKQLIKQDKEEDKAEFMGGKTDAQVRDHFRNLGETLPSDKWDASANVANEVDDDEWSD